jgi:hypothetical protein
LDHNRFSDTSPFSKFVAQREVVDLHILSSEEEPREKGEDAEEKSWKSPRKVLEKFWKRLAKGWEELGEGLGKAWLRPAFCGPPRRLSNGYGLFGPENMF